jgi:hypothetical protein
MAEASTGITNSRVVTSKTLYGRTMITPLMNFNEKTRQSRD